MIRNTPLISVISVSRDECSFARARVLLVEKYDYKNRGPEFWNKRFLYSSRLSIIGFILVVDDVDCGFIGLIGDADIIGLSVWYVQPEFRKYSIDFLNTVLTRLNGLVINSSANPIATRVFLNLGFSRKIEYFGIPRRFFGWQELSRIRIYYGAKYFCVIDNNISLLQLGYLIIKNFKLGLLLSNDISKVIVIKEIQVLFKGGNYFFPLSVHGDRYE